MHPFALTLLAFLAALLIRATVTDLRHRLIGNGLNAAIALAALPWWYACGWGPAAIGLQLALACLMLIIFAALFALGMMGGGDVKLIVALALWLPPGPLFTMLWWMAIGGGLLTLAMLAKRRLGSGEGAIEVPYGVAIAGSTLGVMTNHILTTLSA